MIHMYKISGKKRSHGYKRCIIDGKFRNTFFVDKIGPRTDFSGELVFDNRNYT